MKTKLDLLRAAIEAKHNYWEAIANLEGALIGGNSTNSQADMLEGEVSFLASNLWEEAIEGDVTRLEQRLAKAAPPTPLTYDQFAKAYSECMTCNGNSFLQACVDASWRSYQQDPTGHFMSMTKPTSD